MIEWRHKSSLWRNGLSLFMFGNAMASYNIRSISVILFIWDFLRLSYHLSRIFPFVNGFWVSRLPLFQIADVDVICLLVFESWYPVIVDLQTLSIYLCRKFFTFICFWTFSSDRPWQNLITYRFMKSTPTRLQDLLILTSNIWKAKGYLYFLKFWYSVL